MSEIHPQPQVVKPKTTPQDFFLHIMMIITLYASAISITTILFQIINLTIPDPLSQSFDMYGGDHTRGLIRSSVATLIVMFPGFLAISFYLKGIYTTHPEKLKLWVRKWLLYFTLFVAALIMMVDVITLLKDFLEGEIRWRFILKVLSILLVSGSIFTYFLWDIKKSHTNESL